MVEGMSTREAARVFGLHRDTVRKMLVIHVNYFCRLCANYFCRSDSLSI